MVARARMLGGRTNHWGRISLRMGPYDFKPYSRDGKGFDWPITYDDLAPYYDKAEELIGVFGTAGRPGKHARRQVSACARAALLRAGDSEGLPTRSHPLRPVAARDPDQPLNGRPACHYCGQCGRVCATSSNFTSPRCCIPPAMATGNLEIRCDAMVREVIVGPDGLATGVSYIDKKTRQGSAGARQDRGAGRQLLRNGAPPAELEEPPLPQRPRQFHADWWAST